MYRRKDVKELRGDGEKVVLFGEVVSKGLGFITVNNGTGLVKVYTNKDLPKGVFAMIVGVTLPPGEQAEVKAEIIRKVKGINLSTYRRILEVKREVEKLCLGRYSKTQGNGDT